MKTELIFKLGEDDSRTELRCILAARDMSICLHNIDEMCRSSVKYSDGKVDAEEIRELIRSYVNLDEVIE